ncbi:hypothetical protein KY366_06240 [Candidatus Woesearchaeota archaeon]|nr:hypothetical protein [Candidatus Woesearchaeota archaeon]
MAKRGARKKAVKKAAKKAAKKPGMFFMAYYILALAYAVIGLLDSLVFSGMQQEIGDIPALWMIFVNIFAFAILVLSIIALILFIKKKLARVTLVLPIYHLLASVFVFLYGIIWGMLLVAQGAPIAAQVIPPGMLIIGMVSSLFELGFSGYILSRYR